MKTETGLFARLISVNDGLNRFLVYLSALALAGMSFMIFSDVMLRYFFNSPMKASVEISQLIEPWVIFLPFAWTLAIGGHVQVTLVTMRLSPKARQICDVITYAVDLIFFVILCIFSWKEFAHSYEINEIMMAAIRLPWWSGKLAMPIGTIFIAIQCLIKAILTIKNLRKN